MPYCTSCGSPIPDGQGRSCSMCYGDIDHGRDGYYRQLMEEQQERDEQTRQWEEQFEKDQFAQEMCDLERRVDEEQF